MKNNDIHLSIQRRRRRERKHNNAKRTPNSNNNRKFVTFTELKNNKDKRTTGEIKETTINLKVELV